MRDTAAVVDTATADNIDDSQPAGDTATAELIAGGKSIGFDRC
jgi:hypothetical protein